MYSKKFGKLLKLEISEILGPVREAQETQRGLQPHHDSPLDSRGGGLRAQEGHRGAQNQAHVAHPQGRQTQPHAGNAQAR